MKFIGKMCLHKSDEYVDITTMALSFRLLMCLEPECEGYRTERLDFDDAGIQSG